MDVRVYWNLDGISLSSPTLWIDCTREYIKNAIDLRLYREYHGIPATAPGGVSGYTDYYMEYSVSEEDSEWLHSMPGVSNIAEINDQYETEIIKNILTLPKKELIEYISTLHKQWITATLKYEQLLKPSKKVTIAGNSWVFNVTASKTAKKRVGYVDIQGSWLSNSITFRIRKFEITDMYELLINPTSWLLALINKLGREAYRLKYCELNGKWIQITPDILKAVSTSVSFNVPLDGSMALV